MDLKSANVVLDEALCPKICGAPGEPQLRAAIRAAVDYRSPAPDFGISQRDDGGKADHIRVFTRAYAAPEVAQRLLVADRPAVDVYGIGVILCATARAARWRRTGAQWTAHGR